MSIWVMLSVLLRVCGCSAELLESVAERRPAARRFMTELCGLWRAGLAGEYGTP